MLRKIFVLVLLFHFGELNRNKHVLSHFFYSGSSITYTVKPHLPPHITEQQRYPPSDKNIDQRFDNNESQASTFNLNNYFVNHAGQQQQNQQQGSQQPQQISQNQQPRPHQSQQVSQQSQQPNQFSYQNQQLVQQIQPQQQSNQFPQSFQNQQNSFANQQQGQHQSISNQQPTSSQNQQSSFGNQNQQNSFANKNQVNPIQNDSPTTYRPPPKFDRTSMWSSEESTQKSDQRPSSDNFGDVNKNKYSQDETSSTYPNVNSGIYQNQIPPNRLMLQHIPDKDPIVHPNIPSKIIEIVFPPTLSYDEDASTTTRASIFENIKRRSTTTESYYVPNVS